MLRRQRAIEIVPSSKPLRWRRYDVPQHLAPETSDALRFCAVEGDLDLLDRRQRSTIEAGSFVVSTGPPLARLWRMRPTVEDEWDLEPWDDDPDGVDAHYIRESSEPEIDDEGREIWLYVTADAVSTMTRRVVPGIVLTSAHRHDREVDGARCTSVADNSRSCLAPIASGSGAGSL